MHAARTAKKYVNLLWPDRRAVDMDQIHRWASDDLFNESGLRVTAGHLSDVQALSIVHYYGNVTIAKGHGFTLIDWNPGDNLDGVTIERAAELDPLEDTDPDNQGPLNTSDDPEHVVEDVLDFAMFDLPTRTGPCRKAAAEETDATATTLAREVEAAPYIAEALHLETERCAAADRAAQYRDDDREHNRKAFISRMVARGLSPMLAETMADNAERAAPVAIEVKHGSGKVKV